jgi:hypothetical protein
MRSNRFGKTRREGYLDRRAGLGLRQAQYSVANVLTPHDMNVAAPLAGVEQEH